MSSTIFEIGNISIKWYSILILFPIIISYFYVLYKSNKNSINKEDIIDIFFWTIIFGILGARVYYVIFNLNYYHNNLIEIFKVWKGGLAIHGAIIFGAITSLILAKKKKINIFELLDIFAPALLFSQLVGRWGNFFNQEAYGSIVKLEFLKKIHIPKFIINNMYINGNYHHPTFFYESILCLIGLIILLISEKRKQKSGNIFAIYLIWYGSIRIFIEYLRTDSLMIYGIKTAWIVSILMIIIGIYLLFIRRKDEERV